MTEHAMGWKRARAVALRARLDELRAAGTPIAEERAAIDRERLLLDERERAVNDRATKHRAECGATGRELDALWADLRANP